MIVYLDAATASMLTLSVENAAACASKAWLRFWSTEYSCMKPFTSCGLSGTRHTQVQSIITFLPCTLSPP